MTDQRKKAEQITTVCAYCGKIMSGPKNGNDLSHGICSICIEKHFPENPEEEKKS